MIELLIFLFTCAYLLGCVILFFVIIGISSKVTAIEETQREALRLQRLLLASYGINPMPPQLPPNLPPAQTKQAIDLATRRQIAEFRARAEEASRAVEG
jgi:hypothetical protein